MTHRRTGGPQPSPSSSPLLALAAGCGKASGATPGRVPRPPAPPWPRSSRAWSRWPPSTTTSRTTTITVTAGSKVVWTNLGRNDHNVKSVDGTDIGVDTDAFHPGASATVTFSTPGHLPLLLHASTARATRAWSAPSRSSPRDAPHDIPLQERHDDPRPTRPLAAGPGGGGLAARRGLRLQQGPGLVAHHRSRGVGVGQHHPGAGRQADHPGRRRRRPAGRPHPHLTGRLQRGRQRHHRLPRPPGHRPQHRHPRRRVHPRERRPRARRQRRRRREHDGPQLHRQRLLLDRRRRATAARTSPASAPGTTASTRSTRPRASSTTATPRAARTPASTSAAASRATR